MRNGVKKSQSANDIVPVVFTIFPRHFQLNQVSLHMENFSTHACSSIYLKKDAHGIVQHSGKQIMTMKGRTVLLLLLIIYLDVCFSFLCCSRGKILDIFCNIAIKRSLNILVKKKETCLHVLAIIDKHYTCINKITLCLQIFNNKCVLFKSLIDN